MMNPTLEMRRLAGKFALLLAFVYVLALFATGIGLAGGNRLPWAGWLLLPLPAFAFVPSVRDAIRLHRSSDPVVMRSLWPRCLLLAVTGMVLLVVALLTMDRMS